MTTRQLNGVLAAIAALAVWSTATSAQRPAPPITGGNGLLYMGTYAGDIQILDEATEKLTASIKLKTGIPRRLVLSRDHTRFYVLDASLEKFEIVDIASRTTLDTFTLSQGNQHVRARSYQVDPLNRFAILVARAATRHTDRWEIGSNTLLYYDFAQKKVTRTIPWPKGEEREAAEIRFSPDGSLMYIFAEDVTIYETANFTQVDTWELSRPVEPGFGEVRFGAVDDLNDDTGFFTGLFTVQDPVQNRRLMGIGRVNLAAKSVDFTEIGPAQPVDFVLAPGREKAYGLMQQIGRYEFWTFDLKQKKLASRTEFQGRPRMALRVSSNGKLLYVYQAGATIDVYDATTFRYLHTITMSADQTTALFVLPRPPTPPSTSRP